MEGYTQALSYDAGMIEDATTILWERGWLTIMTSGGVGNPPAPLYIWGLLLEVAQIRLHDGGLAEGDVDLSFALEGLPVGLDAPQVIEALRPALQTQQAALSEVLLGASGLAPTDTTFFFAPSDDGQACLLFRAPTDTPDAPYPWTTPGFFADAALTTPVETATCGAASGRAAVAVTAQNVVFVQARDGTARKIEILDASQASVTLVFEEVLL